MTDSKSNSASSIWMFLLAMLGGAFVLQRANNSGSKEVPNAAAGSQSVPTYGEDHRARDQRLRAPLRAYFGLGEPPPSKAAPKPEGQGTEVDEELKQRLQTLAHLDFLIVTVADPVDSAENYRFDLQLDALHKALAANMIDNDVWVLDRYYLPWQAARERKDQPKAGTSEQLQATERKDPSKAGTSEQLHATEPGVLLYRRALQSKTATEATATSERSMAQSERLLIVYLVGELPTSGLHKSALLESLDEIRLLSKARGQEPSPVMIAGPTFTGSAPSLASALRDANRPKRGSTSLKFYVLTGSALGIDRRLFDDPSLSVTFGATVTKGEDLRHELLNYVRERNGRILGYELPLRVAWLTETGTGFAASQSTVQPPPAKQGSSGHKPTDPAPTNERADSEPIKREERATIVEITDFPYPLHISRVRTSYEQRRAEAKANSSSLGPGRITVPIPFEAIDVARDLPGAMTPNMTAATVDVILTQILDTIRREGIQFVGITATDIRDPIFLADVIRDHCPDVQLLLIGSDLLHGHPEYRQSLSGALVASSYPFFSEAQDWCFPFAGPEHKTVLSNQGTVGLYNALLLLRHMQRYGGTVEVKQPDGKNSGLFMEFRAKNLPPLVCYDLPLKNHDPEELHRPPIWISMIGTNGLWPIASFEAKNSREYSLGIQYDPNRVGTLALDGVTSKPHLPNQPRLSSRLAPLTMFTRAIAPLCVLLVAIAVSQVINYGGGGPDWAQPLAAGYYLPPTGVSKQLVRRYLSFAVAFPAWTMMAVVAGHSAVVLGDSAMRGTSLAWTTVHLVLLLLSLLASCLSVVLVVRSFTKSTRFAVAVWLPLTALFALVAFRVNDLWQRAFLLASSRDILNGVSLLLPALLLSATGTAYGYTKLKHISLLKRFPTRLPQWCPIPARNGETGDWFQPFVRSSLSCWISSTRFMGGLVLLIWCVFLWMGTVNINPQPRMFVLVLAGILLLIPVACGWLLEAISTVSEFRKLLRGCQQKRLEVSDPRPIAWDKVFARRELARPIGLGGLIATLRQRDDDDSRRPQQKLRQHLKEARVALKKSSPSGTIREELLACRREAMEDLWAYEIERFIRQYFVHLRTMAIGLTSVTLLLFMAAGSFPFNTTNLLRLTSSLLVVATAMVVVRSYFILDRDEFLSHMTGTKPNQVQWDWSLIQKVGIFGLLAVIALLSQAFPEMWQWMRTFLEPLSRTVR